jgi:hypothetical protein
MHNEIPPITFYLNSIKINLVASYEYFAVYRQYVYHGAVVSVPTSDLKYPASRSVSKIYIINNFQHPVQENFETAVLPRPSIFL